MHCTFMTNSKSAVHRNEQAVQETYCTGWPRQLILFLVTFGCIGKFNDFWHM